MSFFPTEDPFHHKLILLDIMRVRPNQANCPIVAHSSDCEWISRTRTRLTHVRQLSRTEEVEIDRLFKKYEPHLSEQERDVLKLWYFQPGAAKLVEDSIPRGPMISAATGKTIV